MARRVVPGSAVWGATLGDFWDFPHRSRTAPAGSSLSHSAGPTGPGAASALGGIAPFSESSITSGERRREESGRIVPLNSLVSERYPKIAPRFRHKDVQGVAAFFWTLQPGFLLYFYCRLGFHYQAGLPNFSSCFFPCVVLGHRLGCARDATLGNRPTDRSCLASNAAGLSPPSPSLVVPIS